MARPKPHKLFQERLMVTVKAGSSDSDHDQFMRAMVEKLNVMQSMGASREWILGAMYERFSRELAGGAAYGGLHAQVAVTKSFSSGEVSVESNSPARTADPKPSSIKPESVMNMEVENEEVPVQIHVSTPRLPSGLKVM